MTVEEALFVVKKFLDGRLNTIQETVFRQSWEGQSYLEIASNFGYDPGYVKDAGAKLWQLLSKCFGEKVTKSNFQSVLKQRWQSLQVEESQSAQVIGSRVIGHSAAPEAIAHSAAPEAIAHSVSAQPIFPKGQHQAIARSAAPEAIALLEVSAKKYQDWGDAIDVSVFYGRTQELSTLKRWIVDERCRLVTLLGMGGSGKTALSVKSALQIQDRFDYLFWRSLRNAPSTKELLGELIQFLSKGQETELRDTVDGKISQLMYYLRSSPCLLILDNAESILQSGDRTGSYREGYGSYGQLLRCIADTPHQSCLLITSREKPKGLAAKEGGNLPVRSLQLTGLPTIEARKIFQDIGYFSGSESEWKALIEHYGGNPLVLKMVAPGIQDFFDSDISQFLAALKHGTLVFDDIRNLLEQQINRLSDLEKEVMYWLAIKREPVSLPLLQEDLLVKASPSELIEALASLLRRSLIEKASPTGVEKSTDGFTLQPVVMEYMTQQVISTRSEV
jgi:hypothetical protein